MDYLRHCYCLVVGPLDNFNQRGGGGGHSAYCL